MSADEQREPASAPDNESRATLNDDLRHEDVEVVFRELLGRSATPDDVDSWMPVGSLRVFLDGVLASEEYAGRMARLKAIEEAPAARGSFLNCWVDGWERYARPSGDVSTDGVVIVGESGHLFLAGGSNDNAASHLGDVEVAAGWLEEWRKLMAERLSQARQADRRVAHLIVPDKLAVYADYFPRDLTPRGPRPALRLLDEGRLPLVYPLDALRDARSGGDTYLHADSHLTNRGYRILAEAALRELGVSPRFLPAEENVTAPYLAQGDLGSHFDPPVLELRRRMAVSTKTVVVSDNREDISRVGGHIGMIVVLRNESAPDERTVVIFGDSFSIGFSTIYGSYQGLSWWLAQVFREVHFVWTSFGWDPQYLDSVDAELVVCETAERFIVRVPRLCQDVRSLARRTIERHQAVSQPTPGAIDSPRAGSRFAARRATLTRRFRGR